jgi:hypothetical protein
MPSKAKVARGANDRLLRGEQLLGDEWRKNLVGIAQKRKKPAGVTDTRLIRKRGLFGALGNEETSRLSALFIRI